ncbi:MAG: zinc ribbon domain-containing protein [Clostridia bacterium]|nr:zinc ribbon domain-containing protein [Clostridia bacterium]
MYCSNCGKEVNENAAVCVNCGYALNNAANVQNEADKVSVGLVILAVLIPLFGFIYWALRYKETPKRAKACGIAAIISWVLSFVLTIVLVFLTPLFFDAANWFLYEAYI